MVKYKDKEINPSSDLLDVLMQYEEVFSARIQKLEKATNDIIYLERYLKDNAIPAQICFEINEYASLEWAIYHKNHRIMVRYFDDGVQTYKPLSEGSIDIRINFHAYLPQFIEHIAKQIKELKK